MDRTSKTFASISTLIIATSCLILLNPAFSSTSVTQDTWTSKAPMPTARGYLQVGVADGKIYAIGGLNANLGFTGANEVYDPTSNSWSSLTPMPTPRSQFGIAVYQDKIYVIGGVIGLIPSYQTDVLSISVTTGINQVYDTKTNTWETKSSMPIDRAGMQANTVGGRIYISGGFNQASSFQNSTEAYDPATDSWSEMAPMPNTQIEFASTVLDSKIFFISDKLQIFVPQNNQWATGSSPPKPIFQGAAAATTDSQHPGRIYFIQGGPDSNQIYDPSSDNWTVGAAMPDPNADRLGLAVAVVNGTVYALGGVNTNEGASKVIADNEAYLPISYNSLPITSTTPTIPEFSALTIPLVLTLLAIAGSLVYFKKQKRT